ncbi:MAG: holo-ACP synthase [bacterium]
MIEGIGVDIVDIRRIDNITKRYGDRFVSKVLTEGELKKSVITIKDIASAFAAKEAFVKALGTGFRGIGLKDIEVYNDEKGKPFYLFSSKIEKGFGKIRSHLSISHEKDYVVAMAVIERL